MKLLLLIFSLSSFAFVPKSFKAEFTQETKRLRSIEKEKVTMSYQYPGKVRLEVFGENPALYVCNLEQVWIYFPPFMKDGYGELKTGKSTQYCYAKIFDLMTRGLKDNDYYTVKLDKKKATLLMADKIKKQLLVKKIEVFFKEKVTSKSDIGKLEKMLVYKENTPNAVILVVNQIKPGTKFKMGEFDFTPPKKTNISEM